jgi:hypothetical protein
MSAPATKFTYLAFATSFVLVGCSGTPQSNDEIQSRELALSGTPTPPDPIPTGRHILPPAPPVPVAPPPVCLQIFPCLQGMTYDATPGVCTCVPSAQAPAVCLQLGQCMIGQTFDNAPGVCRCVPAG